MPTTMIDPTGIPGIPVPFWNHQASPIEERESLSLVGFYNPMLCIHLQYSFPSPTFHYYLSADCHCRCRSLVLQLSFTRTWDETVLPLFTMLFKDSSVSGSTLGQMLKDFISYLSMIDY